MVNQIFPVKTSDKRMWNRTDCKAVSYRGTLCVPLSPKQISQYLNYQLLLVFQRKEPGEVTLLGSPPQVHTAPVKLCESWFVLS